MFTQRHKLSISKVCLLLGVTRMSYYRNKWRKSRYENKATEVLRMVEKIRMEMPRIGTRKLHHMLKENLNAIGVGRDRLFAILKANHMLIQPRRSYRTTTDSRHRFRKHRNLIARMEISRPEQVWVADITYIGGRDRHMYLALITDAYSKKIVGYDLSSSLDTSGSLRALDMAHRSRLYPSLPLIHHSDRGLQYCSDHYQDRLRKYEIITSMTETHDPYANAVAERVNGILKQEFYLEEMDFNLETMQKIVKDCIRTYNTLRPHFSCGYLTPAQMHDQSKRKLKTYKKQLDNEGMPSLSNSI